MAPGWGHLVEQIDGSCTILASFTYDTTGTLSSVVLGNPNSGPRYYYAYDAQGNVVDVTDSSGTVVASYSYDAFGALTSSSENFPNGWSNPFRYDGAQGVRYDSETGLYWMSVRAYDPTLGRFISHDPLGRMAAMGLDTQPYVYAGNNPVNNTDPSGMIIMGSNGEKAVRTSKGTKIITSAGNASGHFERGGIRKKKGSGSGLHSAKSSGSSPEGGVGPICLKPIDCAGLPHSHPSKDAPNQFPSPPASCQGFENWDARVVTTVFGTGLWLNTCVIGALASGGSGVVDGGVGFFSAWLAAKLAGAAADLAGPVGAFAGVLVAGYAWWLWLDDQDICHPHGRGAILWFITWIEAYYVGCPE